MEELRSYTEEIQKQLKLQSPPLAVKMLEKGEAIPQDAKRPKTDFAEFNIPFTMTNGVFNTNNTNLISPLLRVKADGKANLVSEALDFRVEPKFVATLKGQGDDTARRGITVPVLVSGTFQAPKFRPDLEGMIKGTLSDPSKLKDSILGPSKEGESSDAEDTVKGILKKLPLGN